MLHKPKKAYHNAETRIPLFLQPIRSTQKEGVNKSLNGYQDDREKVACLPLIQPRSNEAIVLGIPGIRRTKSVR
jgi:hypothetical protein